MKTSRFTQRQVASALPQAEGGMSVPEVGREMGLAEPDPLPLEAEA
jgi:hypothetical protein